jgi:ABC-type spermidine/putrescine transport system permease subunit I
MESFLVFVRACAWLFIFLFAIELVFALYFDRRIDRLVADHPEALSSAEFIQRISEARAKVAVSWRSTALALVSILFLVAGPR